MFKEWKEIIAKELKYEKDGSSNREFQQKDRNHIYIYIYIPTRKFGIEKYNKQNENFTRGAQGQIWADRIRMGKLEDRSNRNCPVWETEIFFLMKKNGQSLRDLWNTINNTNICIIGDSEEERDTKNI